MKCLKCNNEINDNSKFCEYCGNVINNNPNPINNQMYNDYSNQNKPINTNINTNSLSNDVNSTNTIMNNTIQNNNSINNGFVSNISSNQQTQIMNNNYNNVVSNQPNNTNYVNVNSNDSLNSNNNTTNYNNGNMQMKNSINQNISNNMNNDFKTLEGATNLFKSVNCIGNQNIMFIAYKDLNSGPVVSKRGLFASIFGGAIGSFANGVAEGADRKMKSIEMAKAIGIDDYDALLINVTDNGLGIIPLLINGSKVLAKLDKFEPNINNFVFVNNSMIQDIIFDKYPLNSKAKTIKLSINNDIILELFANLEEKLVPYQKESMEKLVNMYSKK